ncbi:hypothetical protein GCM10010302_44140 [Streptomyces polychromogenes]|uniref:Uncharacterized protein n=1 Tax=Streptomyces polychromogenes TaxID=67342 RepID=A0ABP3F8B1_9ACTN
MNPVLLRLYPPGFRRAFGDEMAEAYREATEGAGPRARLREAADVVAHALRLRLGIGSAHAGGRLSACAAPFALATTAAYAAFNLIGTAGDWYVMRMAGTAGSAAPLVTLMNGGFLLTLIGAVVALAGRSYIPGVLCSTAGAAAASVSFLLPIRHLPLELRWDLVGFLLAPVLIAALPLACPPDLRPAPRVRGRAGVLALVAWSVLLVAAVVVTDPLGLGLVLPWRFGVPLAAALVLAGRQAFAGIRSTAALAFAAAPLLATLYFSGWVGTEEVLTTAGAVAVAAVALRIHRGSGSDTPNPA